MVKITAMLLLTCTILLLYGCSGTGINPIEPGKTSPDIVNDSSTVRESESGRVLWGIWQFHFDPVEMSITPVRARNLEAHFNLTPMLLPPNCDNCIKISVNSFNPSTGTLNADITLVNPYSLSGYDVRGILFTNSYKHTLYNSDDWTPLWDIPGGQDINPFRAYAKSEPNRLFANKTEYTENFIIQTPKPPMFDKITYAVDASWPGNCKEPYSIENFKQLGVFYPNAGATVDIEVDVLDWQSDVATVQLSAPQITGVEYVDLTHKTGNTWGTTLVNELGAHAGSYCPVIKATSVVPTSLALYDIFRITISEMPDPTIAAIDPNNGYIGTSLKGIVISGTNFLAPASVQLVQMDVPPILADSTIVDSITTVICDIQIPYQAAPGLYDVKLLNGNDKVATGKGMFQVTEYGWADTWGGGGDEEALSVAVDDSGNIYTSGYFSGTVDFDPGDGVESRQSAGDTDAFLCKFDPEGSLQWVHTWGGTSEDEARSVALDTYGYMYIIGSFNGTVDFNPEPVGVDEHTSTGGSDAFLCKFHTDGDYIWTNTWGGDDQVEGKIITIDTFNNLFATGVFYGEADLDPGYYQKYYTSNGAGDVFLIQFTLDGDFLWAHAWGGTDEDDCRAVAADDQGFSYVSGAFNGTVDFNTDSGIDTHVSNGSWDAFLSKFDYYGNFQWANTWGGEGEDYAEAIDTDSFGNIYAGGWFEYTVDFNPDPVGEDKHTAWNAFDAYMSKFNSDGEYQWGFAWGEASWDMVYGISVDGEDNAYATGWFNNTVDFDPGPINEARTSNGGPDAFLLKYDMSADFQWVVAWGGSGDDKPRKLVVDPTGRAFVVGRFEDDVDFNPWPGEDWHSSNGGYDACLSKFLPGGIW